VARPSDSVSPVPATTLRIGSRTVDIEHRALILGVLDVPAGGASDGATLERLVGAAGSLVADGADLLELVPATDGGPSVPVGAVAALAGRIDVPLAVSTGDAAGARAVLGAGAAVVDAAGRAVDDGLLRVVADCDATLVVGATVDGLGAGAGRDDVEEALAGCTRRALAAGVTSDRIVLDPGSGRPPALGVLRSYDRLAGLGHALAVSVDAGPGGELSGPPCVDGMALGTASLAVTLGCRLVRTRDVAPHHQVRTVLDAVLRAGRP